MPGLGTLSLCLAVALVSGDWDGVPLTIRAVQEGTLAPAPRTVLTLSTRDGDIIHEAIPIDNGIIEVKVPPGKYLLSALNGLNPGDLKEPLKIEVRPPSTIITITVSQSGSPRN